MTSKSAKSDPPHPYGQLDRFVVVVQDRQAILEAVTDARQRSHRQLRATRGPVQGPEETLSKTGIATEKGINRWPTRVSTHLDRKSVSTRTTGPWAVGGRIDVPSTIDDDDVLPFQDLDPNRRSMRSLIRRAPAPRGARGPAKARADKELRIAREVKSPANRRPRVHVASRDRVEQSLSVRKTQSAAAVLSRSVHSPRSSGTSHQIDPPAVGQ